ncbi:MAG TPA: Ig-like domain-containing protein [Gaiellaceae bacterium]
MRTPIRALALVAIALVFPGSALAGTKAGQPFPSNLYTTPDATQLTGLRVDLPQPNCSTNPSDCADVAVLNTLDGFNIQPRISVPFSGPIDVSTVTEKTIFVVGPGGHVVGINQAVWEPLTNTLHFESDKQLAQDTTYLLVVTRGVHDANGDELAGSPLGSLGGSSAYKKALQDALAMAMVRGVGPGDIAAASLFTTQSIDALSRKIRAQLHATPVTFNLGPGGTRTVFPAASPTTWNRQVGTSTFSSTPVPWEALFVFPGSVAQVAYGSFASPDYENADEVIPAVGTKTGVPAVQSTNQLQFTLFVPGGVKPAGGWPVAIFGHGFTDSKNGAPWAVASSLGHMGIASIAINVVGHGFGAAGTYTVTTPLGPVTFPAGGRGYDQNGSGTIDSTEGVGAIGAHALVSNRDGLRQTTIDLMQLVKEIEAGIDFDGDGAADLSTSRIYYAGQSFGGIYGVQLLALEPDIRAGVPNVPGGPIIEIARLSPSFRPLVGFALFTRIPSLYNNPNPAPPGVTPFTNFDENIPLRNLPLVVDSVAGASAIQTVIDNSEWAQQAANPAAYAPFVTPEKTIIQFARGDKTVPNPTTSAILRAGNLASRATLFRNDLAYPLNPQSAANPGGVPKNPHTFLTNIGGAGTVGYALAAQTQIAGFFASDGTATIDPDGPLPFFETPTSTVPEDLKYID